MALEPPDDKIQPPKAPEILEIYRNLVWPEIKRRLGDPGYPKAFKIQPEYLRDAQFHWKTVTEYPERKGKYLRPTLLILSAEAMDTDYKKTLKTAAAMQISEDWLLIHDDIEDKSDVRRGKPALQKIYGIESALNAGDALHVIMWSCLVENLKIVDLQKASKIFKEFYIMLTRTAVGQGVEINWGKSDNFNFTDNDWYFITDGKTSYYTVAGPMRLGAIIAGANNQQLEKIAKFGQVLGRCFQLVDDLLDLLSKDYRGKRQTVGNDIKESKRTLILSHLLRTVGPSDREKIINILKKSPEEKSQDEVDWIIEKMIKHKSVKYAQNIANHLRDEALEIFETDLKFLSKEPARENLKRLINFILERKN